MHRNLITGCLSLALVILSLPASADEEPKNGPRKPPAIRAEKETDAQAELSTDDTGDSTKPSKIIITGPDGVRREYTLHNGLPQRVDSGQDSDQRNKLRILMETAADSSPRLMIGVMCRPLDDVMRRHLGLGKAGVVVTGVPEGMPACAAGLQKGDIIVKAGDRDICNILDLSMAVRECGEAELILEVLHDGESKSVRLKPEVTKLPQLSIPLSGVNDDMIRRLMVDGMGPGMQLQNDQDVEQQIAKLLDKARSASSTGLNSQGPSVEDLKNEIQQMQSRIAELEKQIAECKNRANDAK